MPPILPSRDGHRSYTRLVRTPLPPNAACRGVFRPGAPDPALDGLRFKRAHHLHPGLPVARFYITTAIDYVNGRPHLGHAYEKILADALARFHRQRGDATFFLTGTDEHGQKIAKAAAAAGKDPRAFVNEYAGYFQSAWKTIGVSYDKFIRTTDQRHELAVQELIRRLYDARSPKTGEPVLFEEDYEGLYCEGCEGFKQEKDLDEQGRCPEHKTVPKKIKETNFF